MKQEHIKQLKQTTSALVQGWLEQGIGVDDVISHLEQAARDAASVKGRGKLRTATIRLESVKDADGWGTLAQELELPKELRDRFFEYGEYAKLELEIDESLHIVGGTLIPYK